MADQRTVRLAYRPVPPPPPSSSSRGRHGGGGSSSSSNALGARSTPGAAGSRHAPRRAEPPPNASVWTKLSQLEGLVWSGGAVRVCTTWSAAVVVFCCGSATSSLYASLCVCALFVCMSVCLCLCLLHGLCLRSACMKLACPICIKSWGACSAFGAAGARCVVAPWQPPARAVVRRCAAAADGQRWRLGGQPPPRRVACGGRAAGRDAAPARRGGGGRAGRVRGGGAPAVGARGRECSTAGGAAGGTRVSSRWRWRGSASGRRRLGAASARRHYSARTRPCRRHWHRRNAAAAAVAVTRCWRWGRTCG